MPANRHVRFGGGPHGKDPQPSGHFAARPTQPLTARRVSGALPSLGPRRRHHCAHQHRDCRRELCRRRRRRSPQDCNVRGSQPITVVDEPAAESAEEHWPDRTPPQRFAALTAGLPPDEPPLPSVDAYDELLVAAQPALPQQSAGRRLLEHETPILVPCIFRRLALGCGVIARQAQRVQCEPVLRRMRC